MERQAEKYKRLLQEARLREENFREALLKIRAGYTNDKGDRWMYDVAQEALQENKGGDLQ